MPTPSEVAFIVGIVQIALHAQTTNSRPLPRFEDYPVTENWQGPAVPLRLATTSERMFRTQLMDAAKQPPDFAGHYRFAGWGCGSACAAGAIIDLQRGVVLPPPFGGKGAGWEHWIFCGGIIKGRYIETRRDSRLAIVRCQDGETGSDETKVHYLIWENERLREILHVVQKTSK